MPASPRPNLFSAARRVTDWALCLVNSSNRLFMFFLSLFLFLGSCDSLLRGRHYFLSEPGEEIVPTKGTLPWRGASVAASNSPPATPAPVAPLKRPVPS